MTDPNPSQLSLGHLPPALDAFLGEWVPQCVYAKDLAHLLRPGTDFHVTWNAETVRLENYYQVPHPDRVYNGVCYELTYQLGQALQSRFGDTHLFMAADGNCAPFFSAETTNHTYIAGIPWDCLDNVILFLSEGRPDLPPEICVIDPSFNRYGLPGFSSQVAGYAIKKVFDFQMISPTGDRCEVLPFQYFDNGLITTHTLPLGLLSRLAPEVKEPEQLVVFGFQLETHNKVSPVVFLGTRKAEEHYPVIRRDLEETLPTDHLLNRFLSTMRQFLMGIGSG